MGQGTRKIPLRASAGDPLWEIAELLPEQGEWTEKEYLSLNTTRLVEFDNGMIEVLPMPKRWHQMLVNFFMKLIEAYVESRGLGGLAMFAGYKVRIPRGIYREPDVVYLTPEQDAAANDDFTNEAEWVVEVVSPDEPDRDYVKKRRDYADAGVPEYWIVDRIEGCITVLRLKGKKYVEHGRFLPGDEATSAHFPGMKVSVQAVFDSCH